ncbi:PorP/SprF family type IX secretion system membrane protein [Zobellia nedashkovskayae]
MQYRTLKSFYGYICFTIGVLFISANSFAQKEPQYTQYMYNIGSFNPGYVGSVQNPEIAASYRAQWLDVDGTPRTIRLGTNVPFANEKTGLGLNIISDQLGPSTQTYVEVAYSYQFNVSDKAKLSFGMDARRFFFECRFFKRYFRKPRRTNIRT